MAPPLRKGRALATQRVVGVVFLAVIAGLVLLAVALYQKRFTPVALVDLKTDRIGNQLTVHGDVKVRGLVVGEVRDVRTDGDGATIRLAIDEDKADLVPAGSVAQLLPKTLFGEKFVALVPPPPAQAGRGVRDGDVIQQDRSAAFLETAKVFDDLLPLLQSLKPDDLSSALNAVSGALRGRGDQIGENLETTDAYLAQLNPALPTIRADLRGLADLADTYDAAAPDFLAVLDNLSFSNRSLVDQQDELRTFLQTTTTSTNSLDSLVRDNETRLVSLARDSLPSLQLYAAYSPEYGCVFRGLVAQNGETERTFGGLQPGLHITLETTADQKGYVPGDEPFYGDTTGPTCRGLPANDQQVQDGSFREIPFPVYREADDGYCDAYEHRTPGVQTGTCPRAGSTAAAASASPAAPVTAAEQHDLLALIASPALGTTPDRVGSLADLLFGPMARGTQVALAR